jgi:hypothetical protein
MKEHRVFCLPLPIAVALALALTVAPAMAQSAKQPTPDDPFAALAAKAPQEPHQRGVLVVVRQADGTPAPAAIVVFTPAGDDDATNAAQRAARRSRPTDEAHQLAAVAARGMRYRVDEQGTTRVPRTGSVLAFVGDTIALGAVAGAPELQRLELVLQPIHAFAVDVVAHDGAPAAGVPIVVGDPRRLQTQWRDRSVTTDARGTVAFRLLPGSRPGAMVFADVATRQPVQAQLPLHGDRVRLQLPPMTSVEATFVGDMLPGSEPWWTLQCGRDGLQLQGERTGERSARWPWVEVGAEARTVVGLGDTWLASAKRPIADAAQPLTLVREIDVPTFAMQVLDPDGKPARDRSVRMALASPGAGRSFSTDTNREGWIELELPLPFAAATKVTVDLSVSEGDRTGTQGGEAKLELTPAGAVRAVLPPVATVPLPVLVAGTIVDPTGKPVADLELTFSGPSSQRQRTDAAGRFLVRGRSQRPVQVMVDTHWTFTEGKAWTTRVAPGSENLRLVVQRAARLRIACDPPLPSFPELLHSKVAFQLESAADATVTTPLELPRTGSVCNVPAGTWHLVAHSRGEEIVRLPDLQLQSGVETHDARLLPFDWRAFAVLVELDVLDANGRPTSAYSVETFNELGMRLQMPATTEVARLLLPRRGSRLQIVPRSSRFESIDLGVVAEHRTVVLGGGTALTLVLQPMPELPAGVELVLVGDGGAAMPFASNGHASLVLKKPGSLTPTVCVRRGDTTSAPLDWQLQTLDVTEDGRRIDVELTESRARELQRRVDALSAR